MCVTSRLLRQLALALAVFLPCAAMAHQVNDARLSHGENASVGQDPELTPQGQARARNIATILGRTGVTAIFSTPYARTRQTAQPLAAQLGLQVQSYDPRAPKALVEKVKTMQGPVLVVGHSNTLGELVKLFGGAPGAAIGDEEYDRLYQLIDAEGKVTTVMLRSVGQ